MLFTFMICKDATIPRVLLNIQRLFGGSTVSDSRLSCHGIHCYWVLFSERYILLANKCFL